MTTTDLTDHIAAVQAAVDAANAAGAAIEAEYIAADAHRRATFARIAAVRIAANLRQIAADRPRVAS